MKTLKQQYQQQVRRIKQRIREMTKRGYVVPETVIPKAPKRITSGTIRKLKAIVPKTIARLSEYHGTESYGEPISGERGYQLERKASIRRGVETRRARREEAKKVQARKEFADTVDEAMERDRNRKREEYERFERERRQRDKEERERMEREQARRQQFSEGRMLLQGVNDVIAGATKGESFAAGEMQSILDDAMNDIGEEGVCINLARATEDVVEEAKTVLRYKPNSEGYYRHLKAFYNMVWDRAMSGSEAQYYTDRAEKYTYVNNTEDWNRKSDVGTAGTSDFD